MAFSARVLSRLAQIVGETKDEALYLADFRFLADLDRLNHFYWSDKEQR